MSEPKTAEVKVVPSGWRSPDEIPECKKGDLAYRIVAVRRQHSGQTVSFSASYLNAVPLWFEDENDSRAVTGWNSDEEGDDGPLYRPLLGKGDELMGWREFPVFAPASPPAETGEGEELAGKLTAIRDKFLIPTPDKDFTDYAIITRCIAALSAQPVSPSEGEDWKRADSEGQVLLYTLRQEGWRKGEPIMVNDVTVTIRADNRSETPLEPVVQSVLRGLTHPASDQSDTERMRADWRPISEHDGHGPVLVTTLPESPKYLPTEPVTAFVDVTGVWRCLGSIGGGAVLSQQPTHFAPMPERPSRAALAEKAADQSAATGEA